MDFDNTFLWIAVVSCALVVARSLPMLRQRLLNGWVVVSLFILTVAGTGWLLFPTWVGTVAGSLWFILLLLPTYLIRAASRYALSQRYDLALRLSQVVRLLHPADGWRQQPVFYRALALSQAGRQDQAVALLKSLLRRPGLPAASAQAFRVQLFRILGQWDECLAWIKGLGAPPGGGLLDEASRIRVGVAALAPQFLPLCLRTLGETGRLREMLAAFRKENASPGQGSDQVLGPAAQLSLFAFTGREAAVTALCAGPLGAMKRDAKDFWLATAKMTAGQPEDARADFRTLAARSTDQDLRRIIARRLTHDLPDAAQVLSPAEQDALTQIVIRTGRDHAFHPHSAGGVGRAYATLLLIALNLGMFCLEILGGGSENAATLYRLGAMFPIAVLALGQWYRLLAAVFLHAGPIHLGMNMLALVFIGPWVEKALRWPRYLAVYLFTGAGSSATVLLFMQLGRVRYDLLVGASGAIMGLIGATGAVLAFGWRRERSALAARRLRGVVLIVVLQVVFDMMTPQVSLAAHASGLVLGFAATALLLLLAGKGGKPESGLIGYSRLQND